MLNKKFVHVLNYIHKAAHKNNPRTQSPQQNIKAVLTTAAYFNVAETKILPFSEGLLIRYRNFFESIFFEMQSLIKFN